MILFRKWGYSSAGRAMRSQRIGHEFESRYLHHVKVPRLLGTLPSNLGAFCILRVSPFSVF